ncbi:SpoIIE family protein phosphatase [Mycobacterium fragae]|uniref:Stage II sporulation protein E n=1 Tax=Mycobacterium fragae TaxID=1260918 RepID=A0A1X1UTI1_9MYCO|nr:SpoIIE family protein phosphatase [Mycobacterium fragae]MCV7402847.1 SpoIIE family protein phosphatase [Mycobacterium fragae]ORV60146.1 stage II sporulation protein E [Mycobacterium fragae]
MTRAGDFHAGYAAALRRYLEERGEENLAVGHELGRLALQEGVSTLEIVENHFRLVNDELSKQSAVDRSAALGFLLQTLAPLDVATRGFLDGTKRYEEQRARADDLADRDEFRTALVNSLQEGFFVADDNGAVIEINDAFTRITGYPASDLPYPWPHPWLVDENAARLQQSRLNSENHVQYETPIRHRDGRLAWVAANINRVTADAAIDRVYVGTLRDITAERAFAARESAVLRLATAVGLAKSLDEVLSTTLDECRAAIDVHRVVAAVWPTNGGDPTIHVAGEQPAPTWRDLDPLLRQTFQQARHQLPLTIQPVEWADSPGKSRGIIAVLSGGGDVALWLELRAPRRVSAEDRLLVTVLAGHLGLAIQHVRQFESARETSLTLQHAMLSPTELPPGFAVRYEPAVPPLEIGGDWYDVLPIGDHRIGIIVGDCVGRGLSAAAVMGQLRSSARALLLTGAEPAMLLQQLDAAAQLIPDAFCTTVFLAILDTEAGAFSYSCAGHLPAVLAAPQSEPVLLSDARSVPLAVQHKGSRPQTSVVLPPGSTLMLYTDGLVERRDASIDDGIAQVAEIVANGMHQPVDAVAESLLAEMAPAAGYDDDVAIVVYRRPYPPLVIEKYAAADELSDIRHQLAAWARAARIPDALATDIVLAVNEACANSIEHGYREHEPGKVRVEAENDGARAHLRIIDSGSWKAAPEHPGNRGRGLLLIRAVSDWLELECTPSGTTVDMSFSLSRAC